MVGSGEGVVRSGNRLLYDEKMLIWMAFYSSFSSKKKKKKIRKRLGEVKILFLQLSEEFGSLVSSEYLLLFQAWLTYNCIWTNLTSVPFYQPEWDFLCSTVWFPDVFPFSFQQNKGNCNSSAAPVPNLLGTPHTLSPSNLRLVFSLPAVPVPSSSLPDAEGPDLGAVERKPLPELPPPAAFSG